MYKILSVFCALFISYTTVFSQTTVVLTPADNGTSPWTVPCGVSGISVQLVGAGGAGGRGAKSGSNPTGGGGGGGGEVTNVINIPVSPGQTFTFNVGTGGVMGTNSGNGGNSTFDGATYQANGGLGGTNASGLTPGSGGAGGSGTPGIDGFVGENGSYSVPGPGFGGFGGNNALGSGGAIQTTVVGVGAAGGVGGGGAGGYGGTNSGGNGGDGQITITMSAPSAGLDQFAGPCGTTVNMNATPVVAPLGGTWANVSPAGPTIATPLSPTTAVNGLNPGTNYTIDWQISGAGCITLVQTVNIYTSLPVPNAGNDVQLCAGTQQLNSNTPPAGLTGTWACVSGCGGLSISSATDTAATVSPFIPGQTAVFSWTISNGAGCSATDQVTINYPNECNDGPCGADFIPNTAGLGFFDCLNAEFLDVSVATPSTGMTEPGCGGYSTTDSDIWYAYVVPSGSNGFINLTAQATSSDYMNFAVYTGPCDDLTMEYCNALGYPGTVNGTNSSLGMPFTVGDTIYIRVWEYLNSDATFNICAGPFAFGNSQVLPGMNEVGVDISCGATFTDPGGSGPYDDNQHNVYYICPQDGQFAQINFASWSINSGDQLVILDGAASNAPIIGNITGPQSGTNLTFTASGAYGDSCLTVIWMSNLSGNSNGWQATIGCPTTAGNLPAICGASDCLGGCIPTICAIPGTATFTGVGVGAAQELNESNNGCFQAGFEGEQCTNWFLINPATPGTLTCDIYVNPGQDHDFLVYEAYAPALGCPSLTSNQPIRCNAVNGGNAAGTGFNSATAGTTVSGTTPYNYTTDPYYEPEIVITQAQIDAGIYFIINLKNYNNGCSNPEVDIAFGGTATVSCEPPSILPVELTGFTGNSDGRYNMLYWKTLSELNNDYFTLLGSPDGSNWQELGKVDGAGTTFEPQSYEFEDDILSLQMTYYKLKQTDFDGEFKYSNVIALARDLEFTTIFSPFFPNPSTNTFYFNYGGDYFNQPINLNIYNTMGQIVLTQTYESFTNQVSMSVDCESLAKGMYHVELSQGDKTEYQKIMLVK